MHATWKTKEMNAFSVVVVVVVNHRGLHTMNIRT